MKRKWTKLLPLVAGLSVTIGLCACGKEENGSTSESLIPENSSSEYVSDGETDGLVFKLLEDDTYALIAYTGTATEVEIPEVYQGKKVTKISDRAFYGRGDITEIKIPNTVTILGSYCFYGCSALEEIVIPDSVLLLYNSTFSHCDNLEYTIIDGLKYLGNENNPYYCLLDAEDCDLITEVNIKESCEIVAINALDGCFNATKVTIPNSVKVISPSFLSACRNNIQYNVKEGLKYLGNDQNPYIYLAGADVNTVTEATTIDVGCKFIANYGLTECNALTELVIPDEVVYIGDGAFSGCKNLTNIQIPDGLVYIGDAAFSGCKNLTNIQIPDGLVYIGDAAFYECKNLTGITIPNSVLALGQNTFRGSGLVEITMPYFAEIPSVKKIVVTSSTAIPSGAFEGFASEEIILSDEITSIGASAFYKCRGLKQFVVPKGVTIIPNNLFNDCYSLKTVVLPDGLTTIGDSAFYNCPQLEKIIIPDSVVTIGEGVFNGSTSHKSRNLTVYCEAKSKPDTWENYWNNGHDVYWYRENEPTEFGYFWHYDENGEIAVWEDKIPIDENGLIYTYDNGEFTITGSEYKVGENLLKIPSEFKGYPVTAIGKYALENCYAREIIIPSSIKSLEDCYSERLVAVYCEVGDDHEGYDYGYELSHDERFYKYDEQAYLRGGRYWYYGENGEVIAWEDKIHGTFLNNCSIYYKYDNGELTIKDSLGGVAGGKLVLPSTYLGFPVTKIADEAFRMAFNSYSAGSNKPIWEIVIPGSIKSIGNSAFEGCVYLKKITMEEGVTAIGKRAFQNCSMTDIVIPDSVTTIQYGAFLWCRDLINITVGNGLDYGFFDIEETESESIKYNVKDGLNYLGNAKNPYRYLVAHQDAALTTAIIDDRCEVVVANAFSKCVDLTNVSIPDAVKSMSPRTFSNCSNLMYTIKDGIKYLGNDNSPYIFCAGAELNSIASVTIEEGCKFIAGEAFKQSENLTNVIIPDTVTLIGSSAFYQCATLTNLSIGNSVTTIGASAFAECVALNGLVIPDSVTTIEDYAFQYCSALTDIKLGKGVMFIGDKAFYKCNSDMTMIIPESVTMVEGFALCGTVFLEVDSIRYGEWKAYWSNGTKRIYFYSAEKPEKDGYYWRYVDGVVTIW